MKNHKHDEPAPEIELAPLDPFERRRRNVILYGSTVTPRDIPVNPDQLAAALNMCASAGLPVPLVTTESVTPEPPALPYVIDVYIFAHFRWPQVQIRATVTEVANFPSRVIQLAKNAGIRADSLAITDDPPIAA